MFAHSLEALSWKRCIFVFFFHINWLASTCMTVDVSMFTLAVVAAVEENIREELIEKLTKRAQWDRSTDWKAWKGLIEKRVLIEKHEKRSSRKEYRLKSTKRVHWKRSTERKAQKELLESVAPAVASLDQTTSASPITMAKSSPSHQSVLLPGSLRNQRSVKTLEMPGQFFNLPSTFSVLKRKIPGRQIKLFV